MANAIPTIVEKVESEQDYEGMLRRALERIIQLYTDKSHFVYELLQNAEDAGARNVKFIQYTDRLELLHDGKPFTTQNLRSLCNIGLSDKTHDLNQIGEFGVGFKSVFGICKTVKLYSEPSNYRGEVIPDTERFAAEILDFVKPNSIEFEELPLGYTTRFVFPYTAGKSFSGFTTVEELSDVLSRKLQNLGITTLLFMKSLESIAYSIEVNGETIEGEYLLEKQVINDHCALVSALGASNVAGAEEDAESIVSYLKFSRSVDNISSRTIDIAFPIKVLEDGSYECVKSTEPYISVYFPTQRESKLGFIVQGPFRTTPNRENIPENDRDNIRLANATSELLHDSLIELRDSGKLNMSFVKSLPLSAAPFSNYGLFLPLYEMVKRLFSKERVIPTNSGEYTIARCAKIARPERLATLFSDKLLSELHTDGANYKWLPTYLTQTNAEYDQVYRFLTSDLGIVVIRPEDLRLYFTANPQFLPRRDNDWLVELYSVYENVAAAFSRSKNETNTLTCDIVKTTTGKFVAPCRKTDGKQLISNVFLYTDGIDDPDIHFVDAELYERCRNFFDNILRLEKPNEYEFFIKDIRRRYNESYVLDEDRHIEDFKKIVKYYKHEEYRDEVEKVISDCFVVKCKDGVLRSPYMCRIYLSVNDEGIDIENYFKNVVKTVAFVDYDFYFEQGISIESMRIVGVRDSILLNANVKNGLYEMYGKYGKQPNWWTYGDFAWKLSIESIKEVLTYISKNPTAKDSPLKSYTIFKLLMQNETKLVGTLHIDKATIPNKENEPCDLIRILRGETLFDWDNKWIYTSAGELVSPQMVSRHEITSKYASKDDSIVYELLGFKKTSIDEIDELKKTIPSDKLTALLEHELRLRFGIGIDDIGEIIDPGTDPGDNPDSVEEELPFPSSRVKNWDALRKHVAEMLCYAEPVKYGYVVRKIRTTNKPKEIRAYLQNMYRYDGVYKYACQMCHDTCSDVEFAEMFNKPEVELDPMNLCLCPNCATRYRAYRNQESTMKELLSFVLNTKVKDLELDYVEVPVEEDCLWFTQTHFAEIQELLHLAEEAKKAKTIEKPDNNEDNPDEKPGISVYEALVGKIVTRKDGFKGEVIAVDNEDVTIKIITPIRDSEKLKPTIKYQLSFVINPANYQIL